MSGYSLGDSGDSSLRFLSIILLIFSFIAASMIYVAHVGLPSQMSRDNNSNSNDMQSTTPIEEIRSTSNTDKKRSINDVVEFEQDRETYDFGKYIDRLLEKSGVKEK